MSGKEADMRISDAEREDAMEVLGEHVRTGRLDIDEFGSRSAKVNAAKTVSELAPLFVDLPSPRPSVLVARAAAAPPTGGGHPAGRWLDAGIIPIAAVIAFGLLVLTRNWIIAVGVASLITFVLATRRR